mmetsp:Transcript_5188/g.8191  ORF Transcript_5188/g.8191 Transcript_5188/m.8191 type:complete len:269 (-) Transcript_5188:475-1281(-)
MDPINATSNPNACVASVAPPTATSAEGILGWILGSMNMAAEVPTAKAAADGLMEAAFSPMNPSNSTGFIPAGAVIPSAFGSCPVKMSVPTPVVNPAITDTGTNLATTPSRVIPDASCRAPQPMVMMGSASNPCCSTAPTTKRLIAAAGPVTARVVPPIRPPATPETAAVTKPTSAGTPLAKAMANDRGTAMHPTVKPADTSVKMVSLLNIRFQSGIKVDKPRSQGKSFPSSPFKTAISSLLNSFSSISFFWSGEPVLDEGAMEDLNTT